MASPAAQSSSTGHAISASRPSVSSREGVRSFFGGTPETGPASGSVLADPASGNIFRWALAEIRDTHQNSVLYRYETVNDPGQEGGLPAPQLYLREVLYTGFQGAVQFDIQLRHLP